MSKDFPIFGRQLLNKDSYKEIVQIVSLIKLVLIVDNDSIPCEK
jgi:hypothetical protein